ncbi:MAG: T9SS C-terminal target domain-containing protein, partial [Acidimicrobiia bacterium]
MGGATTFSRLFRRLSVLVPCAVIGATAAVVVPAGAAASVDLDQCRNGGALASSPCDATGWHNGNLNPQQAHYVEGQSAPYRLVMDELPLNTDITVVLGYDIKHGGKHAIDFLTHYDRLEPHSGHSAEDVLPLDGVTGVSGTVGTFPIPAPSSALSPVAGQPTAAFNALPAGERLMTLFGGTISAMAYLVQGDLNDAGNAESQINVTFKADSAKAVLAWGGHIATAADWGAGSSAAGVSGSPYHMRAESWTLGNGKLGNQDRSMS